MSATLPYGAVPGYKLTYLGADYRELKAPTRAVWNLQVAAIGGRLPASDPNPFRVAAFNALVSMDVDPITAARKARTYADAMRRELKRHGRHMTDHRHREIKLAAQYVGWHATPTASPKAIAAAAAAYAWGPRPDLLDTPYMNRGDRHAI